MATREPTWSDDPAWPNKTPNRDHRDISHGDEAGYNVTIQEFTFPFVRNLAPGELEQVSPTPTVYATGTFDHSASGEVTGVVVPTNDIVIPPTPEPAASAPRLPKGRPFELVAEQGPAATDLDPCSPASSRDPPGTLDGVLDPVNMPLENEPQRVRADVDLLTAL